MTHDPNAQEKGFTRLDFWRLCDELSIVQAALLVVGCDPSTSDGYAEEKELHDRPKGYEAAKAAILNALRRDLIKGVLVPLTSTEYIDHSYTPADDSIDITASRVEVSSLRSWLVGRGFETGFFSSAKTDSPDYLDPKNPRYAPKLAAAVRAWQAVTDPNGKHPKQALIKWLRENAADFALSDDEGKPNETGIEEAAKVANWQPGGGAPRTPGASSD